MEVCYYGSEIVKGFISDDFEEVKGVNRFKRVSGIDQDRLFRFLINVY